MSFCHRKPSSFNFAEITKLLLTVPRACHRVSGLVHCTAACKPQRRRQIVSTCQSSSSLVSENGTSQSDEDFTPGLFRRRT